ncbi:MAG: prepilin-type N-terminal cleavage/methylation domain-containing protein [Bdellovibrionia bacterium]
MKNNERGVGLVEVAVSIAILALIAVALSLSSTQQKRANVSLSTKDACHQIARNVASNIKAYENDLTVRNWIPGVKNGNSDTPAINNRDPLCSTSRARGVCAEMELLGGTGQGATANDFYNFLNRRNAATWAYMVYNLSKTGDANFTPSPVPGGGALDPCTIYLADFDPQYLPSPVTKTNLFLGYDGLLTLKLTQSNVANVAQCNRSRLEPHSPIFFQITAGVFLRTQPGTDWETSCGAQTAVGYKPDSERANLTIVFRNLDNIPLPAGRLSQNSAAPYNLCLDPAGQPYDWTNWGTSRGLIADLTASEPGAFFRCEASLSNDPTPGLRKCTSAKIRLRDASNNPVFEGDFDWVNDTDLYNKRPTARAQWGGKPEPTPALRPPLPYATPFVLANRPVFSVAFEATDVGRNQTRVPASSNYFFALEPSCPPPMTYCPNAAPINDGCGGTCPQGTLSGANTPAICPDPKLFCGNHRPCDTCELTSCPGTRGQPQVVGLKNPNSYMTANTPDCPPPNTYYPCEHRYDYCGQLCPMGTKPVPGPAGNFYNGSVACGASPAPNPMPTNPVANQCPNPANYCGTTISGSIAAPPAPGGTQLYNYNRTPCPAGTFNVSAAEGGCPPIDQYCQGAGQFVRDSCGQDCPAGLPGPALRATGVCCLGCNSAGNPPSFKRSTSCDTYRTDLGNVGSCSFINNCYQYNP